MAAARLRVGVIGCGPIGAAHAEAVRGASGAVLAAVCDVTRDRAQALSRRLGGDILACGSVGELLERAAVDAVTVATPDHLHVEVALAAIEAGCHVFCEKPMAMSPAEAARLVDAAAHRGVKLGVDHNRRFGFGYRVAHDLLVEGKLGAVRQVVFHVLDRPPRPEVARVPEVILTTLLTHHLDLARWFGGEVASIRARFGGIGPGEPPLRREVVLTLAFDDGALGAIVAGYRDSQTRTVEHAEIVGDRGTVHVEDVVRSSTFWIDDPDRRRVFKPSTFGSGGSFPSTIGQHVHAFLARVSAGEEPPVTGVDGLRGLELVAAALRSHESGQEVAVDHARAGFPRGKPGLATEVD